MRVGLVVFMDDCLKCWLQRESEGEGHANFKHNLSCIMSTLRHRISLISSVFHLVTTVICNVLCNTARIWRIYLKRPSHLWEQLHYIQIWLQESIIHYTLLDVSNVNIQYTISLLFLRPSTVASQDEPRLYDSNTPKYVILPLPVTYYLDEEE